MQNAFVAYYRVSTQQQGRSGLGLDAQRETVASYLRPSGPQRPLPPRAEAPGQRFEGDELVAFWGVREGTRELGSVYLRVATEPLVLRLARYGWRTVRF